MMKSRLLIVTVMGCLGGIGCANSGAEQPLDPSQLRSEAEDVSFEEIEGATSSLSGISERRRLVIEDVESWAAFWAQLHANISPRPPAPIVDFDNRAVVAAAMGRRPTGGHAIRIEEITRVGDDLHVVVLETSPGPTCLTTQAFSAPATAVSVPRPAGHVDFAEEEETLDCS